ncbi:MAG: hypothetical protein COZ08_02590, partial [Bacteroidetes bacterium CG_4_10_14_3_um_filter_42_6]
LGKQGVVLHVEDAGGHVGTLDEGADEVKQVGVAPHHGADGVAVKPRPLAPHGGAIFGGLIAAQGRGQVALGGEPEFVDGLPHLLRDAV